jgi:hypothetical protein
MQILKFILVLAVMVFQVEFAQAGRSASYYKAAKYFKATPKKAVKRTAKKAGKKAAKVAKLKKSAKNKRAIASVSSSVKHKLKKSKSARLPAKKKHLR